MKAIKIAENIYRIGANISDGDLFEGIWPIPDGVSLNAYVIKGEKNVMIDLVQDRDAAPEKIIKQLESISLCIENFDYLILNHLEPDHTGWLGVFLERNPGIQIITTEKGSGLVRSFFSDKANIKVVSSGDSIKIGKDAELVFEETPNVHWPETMVTYETKSGILFSCDAFGSYGNIGESIFDDQLSEEEHIFFDKESLRYYSNIISSFSPFVIRAIDKLKDIKIKMIAPSHGIIWRENPSTIIDRYIKYAGYMTGPAEKEITIVWGSMYGHTKEVLQHIIAGIRSENVPVHVHRLPQEDISHILANAWKSSGLIFGMPTYEYKMFPPVSCAIDMFGKKHVWNKKVFRFGSYGWSGGAQKDFEKKTEKMKWDFLPALEWQGKADKDICKTAFNRGKELAVEIKAV